MVTAHLARDPLSGDLFVFRNKRGDRLKILAWQGDGFALYLRRLEKGTFAFPAADSAEVAVTPSTCTAGSTVKVTITYPFAFLTGYFGAGFTMTGKAAMQCGG